MLNYLLPIAANATKKVSLISLGVFLGISSFSCRNLFEKLGEAAFPKERILTSAKKGIQLTIPKGWREDKSLNEQADIQASSRLQENYILVFSENKADFDEMNTLKHSDLTSSAILNSLKKGKISERKKIQVNGKKAYQYIIDGVIENIKLTYIHTTIDGQGYYHQIMAWTLKSRFKENEAVLQKITNSFREISRKTDEE